MRVCRKSVPTAVATLAVAWVTTATPFATSALAFDGEWSGFVLGASAGVGGTSGRVGDQYERDSALAGSTGFRFGPAFGRYAILFMSHTTWSEHERETAGGGVVFANGNHSFNGLVVVRAGPRRLSPYPLAGVGLTTWGDVPLSPESNVHSAVGFLGGVGVEPWKHWSAELVGYTGFLAEEDYAATHSWSIQLLATATAY